MENGKHGFRIGDLASRLQVNAGTIRYYEMIGLLPPPPRSRNGYRLYNEILFERLRFILKAKALGFSLNEIEGILSLRDRGKPCCEQVVTLLDRKLATIEEQLRMLTDVRAELLGLRRRAGKTTSAKACFCAIIEQS